MAADLILFKIQGDTSNFYVTEDSAIIAANELVRQDGKPRDIIRVAEKVVGTVSAATPIYVKAV